MNYVYAILGCLLSLFIKHEDSSSYSSRLSRKGNRNSGNDVSTTARHSRKGRVAKNDGEVALGPLILDLSTNDQLCELDTLHTEALATSTLSSNVNIDNIQEYSEGLDAGLSSQSRTIHRSSDGIEKRRDLKSCISSQKFNFVYRRSPSFDTNISRFMFKCFWKVLQWWCGW